MTERIKQTVPIWIVSLSLPLLVIILITLFANVKIQAETNGQLKTQNIEINKRLDRIETKVDNYIILHNGK